MVVGWGRSGSTLLDRLLGQLPGVVSLGELREFWLRGPMENRRCGCGKAFDDCPHWRSVVEALSERGLDDARAIQDLRRRVDRGWTLPLLRGRGARLLDADLRAYRAVLASTYDSIHAATGAQVLVDSSKLASHALVAHGVDDLDLRFLHVVRDPRAVLHSWARRTARGDSEADEEMLRYGGLAASLRYRYYNRAAERLAELGRPLLRVRYEDLVADPRQVLAQVAQFLGRPVDDQDLAFLRAGSADLGVDHLIDGNPMRFTTGTLDIRTDEAWRRSPSTRRDLMATTVTRSLMKAYGYSLRDS